MDAVLVSSVIGVEEIETYTPPTCTYTPPPRSYDKSAFDRHYRDYHSYFKHAARVATPGYWDKYEVLKLESNRNERLLITLATVSVLLISIGVGFLSVKNTGYQEFFVMLSLGIFMLAFLLALIRGQLLKAKKIDTEIMVFKGARTPFLDSLPEYAEL